jgi:hypothetical protein
VAHSPALSGVVAPSPHRPAPGTAAPAGRSPYTETKDAGQCTLLESILTHPRPTPAAWRSACERAPGATERQAQLIEALLTLARSQQSPDHREPIDLAP